MQEKRRRRRRQDTFWPITLVQTNCVMEGERGNSVTSHGIFWKRVKFIGYNGILIAKAYIIMETEKFKILFFLSYQWVKSNQNIKILLSYNWSIFQFDWSLHNDMTRKLAFLTCYFFSIEMKQLVYPIELVVRGRSQTTMKVVGFFWPPTPLRW